MNSYGFYSVPYWTAAAGLVELAAEGHLAAAQPRPLRCLRGTGGIFFWGPGKGEKRTVTRNTMEPFFGIRYTIFFVF